MSRVKLSEYRSKVLLNKALGGSYDGHSISLLMPLEPQIKRLKTKQRYVVKVDQAVKKRNKLGLVFLNRSLEQVRKDLETLRKKGYDWALVEPFVPHIEADERYVALRRTNEGVELLYSDEGGVEVEAKPGALQRCLLDHFELDIEVNTTNLPNSTLAILYELFKDSHMTYLEINPVLFMNGLCKPLDSAAEVDSAAEFFIPSSWAQDDIRNASRLSVEEKAVEEIAAKSPASFNLKILNKDGGIFLLLSGGGASVVVADEFASQGYYKDIANYGEYSGGPNAEETCQYTKQVLALLLASKAKRKVLFIGGGTANFTDVAKTFKGVLQAMGEVKKELQKDKVSVFVRRGGPNQEKGLSLMKDFLDEAQLVHEVCGPDRPIAELVKRAVKELA